MNLVDLIDLAWGGDPPASEDLDLVAVQATGFGVRVVVSRPGEQQAWLLGGGAESVWSSWVRDPAEVAEVEVEWEGEVQFGFVSADGAIVWSDPLVS